MIMKTELMRRIARLLYGFTICLLLMEMVLISLKNPPVSFGSILVLGLCFVVQYYARERVSRLWQLLALTGLICLGIWFIPEILLVRLLLIGINAGLYFGGAKYVMSGGVPYEAQEIPWPGILLGIASTGSGLYYERPQLVTIAAVVLILHIISFLLVLYADGVQQYVESTRDVKGIPIRRMVHTNSWIVAGIILIMVVGILIGEALGLPDALVSLLKSVGRILLGLFSGVVLLFKWIVNLLGGGSRESVQVAGERFVEKVGDPGTWSEIVLTILRVILLIFLLYLLVRIFARIFKVLVARFQKVEQEKTAAGTEREDIRERTREGGVLKEAARFFTPEERARRIYRKAVLHFSGPDIPGENATAGDICQRISTEQDMDIRELTRLYEAVRYGAVKVDRAYLSGMKQAAKGLSAKKE